MRVLETGIERERALERVLDALAVARRRQPLDAQDAHLHPRAVGRPEVEPRLGAPRLPLRPGLGSPNRLLGPRQEVRVARPVLGVELDLPPLRP